MPLNPLRFMSLSSYGFTGETLAEPKGLEVYVVLAYVLSEWARGQAQRYTEDSTQVVRLNGKQNSTEWVKSPAVASFAQVVGHYSC